MTKEEKIKEAYGEFWLRLSEEQKVFTLAYDGAVQIGYSEKDKQLFKDIVSSGLFDQQPTRPKSLIGIKNNNGWIKIESEEDLPKSDQIHYLVFANNEIKKSSFNVHQVTAGYQFGEITHYKPIIIQEKPIY